MTRMSLVPKIPRILAPWKRTMVALHAAVPADGSVAVSQPSGDRSGLRLVLSPDESNRGRDSWLLLAIVMLAFVGGLFPFVANHVVHYPDERHYTDAAFTMLDNGDYLTPRTPEGQLRLNKPIVTYWLVAGGYHLLGINVLAARLPFALMGAALIWLSYHTAKLVFENRLTALLAAAITATCPVVMLNSMRSIPDMPLCFFMMLSMYGFLGLFACGRRSVGLYAAFYGGAALAVLTKGVPGASFALFAAVFAILNPWKRVSWRSVLHRWALPSALAAAGSWFAIMWCQHGLDGMRQLSQDQVTGRVTASVGGLGPNIPYYIAVSMAFLAPWLLPMICPWNWRHWRLLPEKPEARAAYLFILCWIGVYIILASFIPKPSDRYTLPIIPAIALLIADAFTRADRSFIRQWFDWTCKVLALLLVVLAVLSLAIGQSLGWKASDWLIAMAVIVTDVAVLRLARHRGMPRLTTGVCAVALVLPLAVFPIIQRFALPDQGGKIAKALRESGVDSAQTVTLMGTPALASKVRMYMVRDSRRPLIVPANQFDEIADPAIAVVSTGWPSPFDAPAYETTSIPHSYDGISPWNALRAWLSGDLRSYLESHQNKIILAVRSDDATSSDATSSSAPANGDTPQAVIPSEDHLLVTSRH